MLRLYLVGVGRQTQREFGAVGKRHGSRQQQQAPSEAAFQPHHASAAPGPVRRLHFDHLPRMLAQERRELRTPRLIPLVKHDDRDLQLVVGVCFERAADDRPRWGWRRGLRSRQKGHGYKQSGGNGRDNSRKHHATRWAETRFVSGHEFTRAAGVYKNESGFSRFSRHK